MSSVKNEVHFHKEAQISSVQIKIIYLCAQNPMRILSFFVYFQSYSTCKDLSVS